MYVGPRKVRETANNTRTILQNFDSDAFLIEYLLSWLVSVILSHVPLLIGSFLL